MNPILRIANLDDLPTLLEFEQRLIKAERPMDPSIKDGDISYYDISEMIKATNSEVFVVELDHEIVASGYAKIIDDRNYLKHTKQGYLGFMYVPEEHRGKGLNKLILDALIDWCKARNVFEIRLDVYDVNETAIKAYKKSGFKNYLINMRFDIED
ncbi:MAG: GNAT family N-acetyltransferase [Bacteroidetes bacterium]|nr:MAG: GNAT family N-acetyltransferase [Bacteroidota bacterium]